MKNLFYICMFLLLAPSTALAATLSVVGQPQQVGVGDLLLVSVRLDSDTPVNAFSGVLRYPADLLEPAGVREGASVVTAWLTRPDLAAAEGRVRFEGVTAGGYSGRRGELFSALFKIKSAGAAHLSLAEVSVLRNDGAGTAEETALRPLTLALRGSAQGGYIEAEDREPPEPLAMYLGQDPELFVFRSYLVFEPEDKGTGVASVEVRERRPFWWGGEWRPAESPYVLEDQYLTSAVDVRLRDYAGNERISTFPHTHLLRPHESLLGLILVVLLCLLYFVPSLRSRFF